MLEQTDVLEAIAKQTRNFRNVVRMGGVSTQFREASRAELKRRVKIMTNRLVEDIRRIRRIGRRYHQQNFESNQQQAALEWLYNNRGPFEMKVVSPRGIFNITRVEDLQQLGARRYWSDSFWGSMLLVRFFLRNLQSEGNVKGVVRPEYKKIGVQFRLTHKAPEGAQERKNSGFVILDRYLYRMEANRVGEEITLHTYESPALDPRVVRVTDLTPLEKFTIQEGLHRILSMRVMEQRRHRQVLVMEPLPPYHQSILKLIEAAVIEKAANLGG